MTVEKKPTLAILVCCPKCKSAGGEKSLISRLHARGPGATVREIKRFAEF